MSEQCLICNAPKKHKIHADDNELGHTFAPVPALAARPQEPTSSNRSASQPQVMQLDIDAAAEVLKGYAIPIRSFKEGLPAAFAKHRQRGEKAMAEKAGQHRYSRYMLGIFCSCGWESYMQEEDCSMQKGYELFAEHIRSLAGCSVLGAVEPPLSQEDIDFLDAPMGPVAPPRVQSDVLDAEFVNDIKLLDEFALHEEPCGSSSIATPCTCDLDAIRKRIYRKLEEWHRRAATPTLRVQPDEGAK